VTSGGLGAPLVTQPLRILCPVSRPVLLPYADIYQNSSPECGLANSLAFDDLMYKNTQNGDALGPFRYPPPWMVIKRGNSCPLGSYAPMDTCLSPGNRISYPFWDPASFGDGTTKQLAPPAAKLHRLPAISLRDIEPSSATRDDCRASWDPTVPVRCGSDMTRYLVAKLGARGQADTTTWPTTTYAAPSTFLELELFRDGADVSARWRVTWQRFDSQQTSATFSLVAPVIKSMVITQTAGPNPLSPGEEKLSWASSSTDLFAQSSSTPLFSVSVTNAYPADNSSSTSYNRYGNFFFSDAMEAGEKRGTERK